MDTAPKHIISHTKKATRSLLSLDLTCRPNCFKKRTLFPHGSAGVTNCTKMDAPSVAAVEIRMGDSRKSLLFELLLDPPWLLEEERKAAMMAAALVWLFYRGSKARRIAVRRCLLGSPVFLLGWKMPTSGRQTISRDSIWDNILKRTALSTNHHFF